uniref:DNA-directed RNA polymerase n=1 Tax=Hyalogonium fusiforme TaxID=2926373 RepID=A0A9E8ADS2_9CHLO|nr:RNA polymerase subunit beta [Hyalogonium fusiforme]
MMPIHRYFLSDLLTIQRQSFFQLLEKGLIEEFQKRNPITNIKRDLEIFFYPEHYRLTRPEYSPQAAILKNKSYTSKLFVPVQLTDKTNKKILLKWVYIGNIPMMTKRGHFILNGAARVIVNQILRSPGIYYQQKIYENYSEKWSQKPDDTYRRYYADLICMRGTWLRIEMDKEKKIWAQTKKGPKIPIYWFLLAMGLSEKTIFKSIRDSNKLLGNLENNEENQNNVYNVSESSEKRANATSLKGKDGTGKRKKSPINMRQHYFYLKNPPEAWREIYYLVSSKKTKEEKNDRGSAEEGRKWLYNRFLNPRSYDLGKHGRLSFNRKLGLNISATQTTLTGLDVLYATDYLIKVEKGIAKIDDIDHLKNRRVRTSGELIQIQIGVGLVRLEKSIRDTLNKTSLLRSNYASFNSQMPKGNSGIRAFGPNGPLGAGFSQGPMDFALDKVNGQRPLGETDAERAIARKASAKVTLPKELAGVGVGVGVGVGGFSPLTAEGLRPLDSASAKLTPSSGERGVDPVSPEANPLRALSDLRLGALPPFGLLPFGFDQREKPKGKRQPLPSTLVNKVKPFEDLSLLMNSYIYTKAFNSAIREFFGTSPLSQFMDQINPLAELTHKRRLSSMGPGGVTRDTATLEIRGIHPTHYGRICPIETPEGKNTGLVNSMTTYARVNPNGILESPFYKVYKGQVQKNTGIYFLSAEQEEKIKLAAADLSMSSIGFLPKSLIPVRIAEDFTKISRSQVQYIGVSPVQMISIAASLIPFLEHDDANRALMGSNMQRQAVPLIRPERPIVGTGLEARAVSDSGHAIISKYSGLVTYVSAKKIVIHSFFNN